MQLEIKIDDMVYQEVMHYVNKSDFEVSGLGKVVVEKEDGCTILRVTKVIILPQENTPVHTEIDPVAIGRAEYQLRNEPGDLRWWWHSHVKMDAFWSSEDMETIAQLSSNGWFCATVFNQDEETRSAYAQAGPVRLFMDELLTYTHRELPDGLVKSWDEAYTKNVKNVQSARHWSKYLAGADKFAAEGLDADDSGDWIPPRDRRKNDIDITDSILEAAIDAGLSEDEAEEYTDLAERLLEDGHYSASAIEAAIVQKVLDEARGRRA